jgi:YidC/Oxa1 family membrane protein insertase
MDNKTLLAIVLSIAVIIGFQYFFAPKQPHVVPQKQTVAAKEEPAKPAPVLPAPETPSGEEKEIKVENSLFSAVLSSKGGTITFWEIKGYKDKTGKDVVILRKPGVLPALAIGADTNFSLANVNFSVTGGDLNLSGPNKSGSVVFEYSKDGQSVKRTYTFYSDSYRVDLTDEVTGLPSYWITLGSDFGIYDSEEGRYAFVGPALLKGTQLSEFNKSNLENVNFIERSWRGITGVKPKTEVQYKDSLKWIAQEDKYFCSALVPASTVESAKVWLYKDNAMIAFQGKPGVNKFSLYAGPKEPDRLAKLDGLKYIIDYGIFSIIARPLFWILKFFHGFLGNYGWSIILLTIVVRIPFLPLVAKGQKSMRKLQMIQPKMNEIKEKYKKDPQKMQQEMMELYKKHKVNPMGGCLPMIIQIPVFFALYKVLLVSIELRGAPFILWITDLSAPDTLFGHFAGFSLGGPMPYLMGITMLIQQKMTPSGMDPKQAKMMMLMPIVFTFMFLNFASGLVLYWLVNNILSIIQQFYINRRISRKPAAA